MNNSIANGNLSSAVGEQININESDSAVAENIKPMINSSDEKREGNQSIENGENNSSENANNQLVLYDPAVKGGGEIVPVSDPIASEALRMRRHSFSHQTSRVLPSVGAFTVQCANCFKWRLIPTKEKYEEIREHILDNPFVCEAAREWRPDVSCDDDPDIEQDGTRLWAIDKPNIAQPPPGWERLLRIRGEGSTKFADVYYESPSGKRLRSMVEIQRFLEEHPEYRYEGVTMDKFSFQIPRPLQENYVRKKVRSAPLHGEKVKELEEAKPLALEGPNDDLDLTLRGPTQLAYEDPLPVSDYPSRKRKRTPSKRSSNGDLVGGSGKVEGESLQL